MEIFKGEGKLVSQYIDSYGKARALHVKYMGEMATIFTPPSAPKCVPLSKNIYRINYTTLKNLKLNIIYQSNEDGETDGLWVQFKRLNYFIPVEPVKTLDDIPHATADYIDPLRVDADSELEEMRVTERVASMLKSYALYEYSLNPKKFGRDTFVIKKSFDHTKLVAMTNSRIDRADAPVGPYLDGKLVVDSAKTRDNLISYVNVQVLNDESRILEMKNRTNYLNDFYTTLSDFKEVPNQIVFVNRESIEQWSEQQRNKVSKNLIYTAPQIKSIQPYFYENKSISQNVMLMQNVNLFQDALSIGEKWYFDNINLGYYVTRVPVKKISYKIYKEDGVVSQKKQETDYYVKIFEYYTGEYAAILEL